MSLINKIEKNGPRIALIESASDVSAGSQGFWPHKQTALRLRERPNEGRPAEKKLKWSEIIRPRNYGRPVACPGGKEAIPRGMASCFLGWIRFFSLPVFLRSKIFSPHRPLASRHGMLVVSELPQEQLTQAFRKWKSTLAATDGGFARRMWA